MYSLVNHGNLIFPGVNETNFPGEKKNMMISDKFDPHDETKREGFAFELFRPRNS